MYDVTQASSIQHSAAATSSSSSLTATYSLNKRGLGSPFTSFFSSIMAVLLASLACIILVLAVSYWCGLIQGLLEVLTLSILTYDIN